MISQFFFSAAPAPANEPAAPAGTQIYNPLEPVHGDFLSEITKALDPSGGNPPATTSNAAQRQETPGKVAASMEFPMLLSVTPLNNGMAAGQALQQTGAIQTAVQEGNANELEAKTPVNLGDPVPDVNGETAPNINVPNAGGIVPKLPLTASGRQHSRLPAGKVPGSPADGKSSQSKTGKPESSNSGTAETNQNTADATTPSEAVPIPDVSALLASVILPTVKIETQQSLAGNDAAQAQCTNPISSAIQAESGLPGAFASQPAIATDLEKNLQSSPAQSNPFSAAPALSPGEKLKSVPSAETKTPSAAQSIPPAASPTPDQAKFAQLPEEGTATQAIPAELQLIEIQQQANVAGSASVPPTPAGTGGALNTSRMKFAGQKNESAGSTVQKLPRTSDLRGDSSISDTKGEGKTDSVKPALKDDSSSAAQLINLRAGTATVNSRAGEVAGSDRPQAAADPSEQVEKISSLVSREAVTIRQTGATSLAVSLKVDSHTEVFVQLTSHEGQIQASVRCERGSLPGLDTHWGQLQESLARQNIQLLPLTDRVQPRSPVNTAFGDPTAARNFNQSSHQQQERPAQETRGQVPQTPAAALPARARDGRTANTRPRGWESWA